MVIHIRDEATDKAVRELAQRRGISLTEAVREATEEALAQDEPQAPLWERLADLRARMETYPRTGQVADKQFYDELWGQEND